MYWRLSRCLQSVLPPRPSPHGEPWPAWPGGEPSHTCASTSTVHTAQYAHTPKSNPTQSNLLPASPHISFGTGTSSHPPFRHPHVCNGSSYRLKHADTRVLARPRPSPATSATLLKRCQHGYPHSRCSPWPATLQIEPSASSFAPDAAIHAGAWTLFGSVCGSPVVCWLEGRKHSAELRGGMTAGRGFDGWSVAGDVIARCHYYLCMLSGAGLPRSQVEGVLRVKLTLGFLYLMHLKDLQVARRFDEEPFCSTDLLLSTCCYRCVLLHPAFMCDSNDSMRPVYPGIMPLRPYFPPKHHLTTLTAHGSSSPFSPSLSARLRPSSLCNALYPFTSRS